MIDILRNQTLKTAVWGAVIVVTVLLFVMNWGPNMGSKRGTVRDLLKDDCAASVVGSCVDLKSFRATTRMMLPRDSSGNIAQVQRAQRLAVSALIERELLAREAERLGLTVTEDEVNDSILGGFIRVSSAVADPDGRSQPMDSEGALYAGFRDAKTKKFDDKVYRRSVRSIAGTSPVEFREWQQREILAAKMRDIVQAPVRVSEEEALHNYVGEKSNASVSYVVVKDKWAERYVMTPPTAIGIDDWAKSNEALVKGKESTIRHILIKSEGSDAGAEAKEKARLKAEDLLARLKKGEDFERLARDFSQDTGSAMQGGDVGTKTDSFVENFKNAADALKPGETVPAAVETQFGFHIIRKDDPTRAAYIQAKSADAAKAIATKIHAAVKAGAPLEEAISVTLAASTHAGNKPGKAPAAEVTKPTDDGGAPPPAVVTMDTATTDPDRPQLSTTNGFNRGGDALPGLESDANRKLVEWSFGAKDGELFGETVPTMGGTALVVQKTHKLATRDDFEKERDAYVTGMLTAKRVEALSLYVRRLREAKKEDIKIDESIFAKKPDGDAGADREQDQSEEE